MTTYTTHAQERIARETYHDALFLGIDGDGAAHYWSAYHQAVVVLDGTDAETHELAETPLERLSDWLEHTRRKRGPWELTKTTGSAVQLVADAVEA